MPALPIFHTSLTVCSPFVCTYDGSARFFFLNFDHVPKASQEHRIYIAWHPPPPFFVYLQASLTMPCKCTKPPLMFSSWGASVLTNHDVVRRMNMQGSLHATAQFVMAHLPPVRQPPSCVFSFLDPISSASLEHWVSLRTMRG